MDKKLLSSSYSFTIEDLKITADVDDSLSYAVSDRRIPAHLKRMHSHPMHEIFFVYDEPIFITTHNGTKEYKNCIICIPPHLEHFTVRSTDYRMVFSFISKENSNTEFRNFFINLFSNEEICVIGIVKKETKLYLDELTRTIYSKKTSLEKEVAISALKLIFYHIYLCGTKTSDKKRMDKNSESYYLTIDNMIFDYMNSDDTICIEKIANAFHLSKKQTSRIIKKYYNKPLSAVLLEVKLRRAADLLIFTDIPVAEIVKKSKFHSENYFFIQFKKAYGETPLHYRKKRKP